MQVQLDAAVQELNYHISKLNQKYGSFSYAEPNLSVKSDHVFIENLKSNFSFTVYFCLFYVIVHKSCLY